MRPASRLAWATLLWLCCGAQALAGESITNLASGSYTCATGDHRGNINELNMSSANGQANYIEVKVLPPVLDTILPSSTKLCYTTKNTGHSLDSICQTLGSASVKVYRDGAYLDTGANTSPFAVGDYLVMEVPGGTNEVNEAMLLTSANAVIDHIQLCTGICSTGYWSTAASCGAQLPGVGKSVKDIARYPTDGTGTWSSNTLNSGIPAKGTRGASNSGVSGLHHFELRSSGSALSCAASTLTIKACGNAACDIAYTDGASGTLSAVGGNIIWDDATGGADGADFVIEDNTSSITKNFQALGTATLGITGLPTTCNFGGSTPCQFTALSAGFILANSRTSTTVPTDVTIPTQTAGAQSATYYLRALQAATNNPAVCTPVIFNPATPASVPVRVSYACDDPHSCQDGNLLKVLTDGVASNATGVPAGGGDVNFVFDANGSASFGLLYEDVGKITVTASKSFTPFTGATTVTFTNAKQFVVKPHHFDLSGIDCPGAVYPAATSATGNIFCKAGANFSVTATARSASGATTQNFGLESTPESVKLTSTLAAGLGLSANPSVGGGFTSLNKGVMSGSAFTWNEVGIITLTPSIADSDYLDAGDVIGTASGNVGRFVPDHYDTALTAPAPLFAYSGQPIAVDVTAKLAAPTAAAPLTATSVNYMAAGFSQKVTLSALAADGSALAAGLGTLSSNGVLATDFSASIGAGTPVYTFTAIPTKPTVIRLHAKDTDNVTSALTEASIEIRSGRLRLSNAFGRANADLGIPVRAEYWSGNSWIVNSLDNLSKITKASVALNPNVDTLKDVTVNSDVTLGAGQGTIVLSKPTAAPGSVDLAVNLGSAATDHSCLTSKRPNTVGAALPWLRYLNGNCATGADSDPSARGTFGIYKPETRKVIHIRESFN